jgi:hypothetical protein
MMANNSKRQPTRQRKDCDYKKFFQELSDVSDNSPIDDSDTAFEYSSTEGSSSIDESGDDSSSDDSEEDDGSTGQSEDGDKSTDRKPEFVVHDESNSSGEEYSLSGSSSGDDWGSVGSDSDYAPSDGLDDNPLPALLCQSRLRARGSIDESEDDSSTDGSTDDSEDDNSTDKNREFVVHDESNSSGEEYSLSGSSSGDDWGSVGSDSDYALISPAREA